ILLQHLVTGLGNIGLRLNELQLGLIDIELGNRTQLELPLRALEELVRQVESAFLDTEILTKLDRLPVGQLSVGYKLNQRGLKVVLALADPATSHHDGQPVDIGAAVSQQRLGKAHRQTGVIGGIEIRESAVGGALNLG